MSVPILRQKDHGLLRMGGKPQLHRDCGWLRLGLIDGLRLLIKLPGLPAVFLLPGAEHLRALVPGKVAVGKALPGKNRLQPGKLLRRGRAALCQRLFINAGDQRGIFRPLHAALDLQGMDAGLLQLGKMLRQGKILQAQRMLHALAGKAVGHPAGLGAQAPVAAAAADHGGHQALAGTGDAQRSMHESLQLRTQPGAAPDFFEFHFPGQYHPGKAPAGQIFHPGRVMHRHLSAGVEHHFRRNRPADFRHPQILHDERVSLETFRRMDFSTASSRISALTLVRWVRVPSS